MIALGITLIAYCPDTFACVCRSNEIIPLEITNDLYDPNFTRNPTDQACMLINNDKVTGDYYVWKTSILSGVAHTSNGNAKTVNLGNGIYLNFNLNESTQNKGNAHPHYCGQAMDVAQVNQNPWHYVSGISLTITNEFDANKLAPITKNIIVYDETHYHTDIVSLGVGVKGSVNLNVSYSPKCQITPSVMDVELPISHPTSKPDTEKNINITCTTETRATMKLSGLDMAVGDTVEIPSATNDIVFTAKMLKNDLVTSTKNGSATFLFSMNPGDTLPQPGLKTGSTVLSITFE